MLDSLIINILLNLVIKRFMEKTLNFFIKKSFVKTKNRMSKQIWLKLVLVSPAFKMINLRGKEIKSDH